MFPKPLHVITTIEILIRHTVVTERGAHGQQKQAQELWLPMAMAHEHILSTG